jgi:hypothetical protein
VCVCVSVCVSACESVLCPQVTDCKSSSSMWGRRLPTECTAAYRGLLY